MDLKDWVIMGLITLLTLASIFRFDLWTIDS